MGDRLHAARFAIVPEWLLDAGVSGNAVALFALLHRYGESSGVRFPARKTLAERLRCSLSTTDRARAELVDAGALVVTARHAENGRQRSNRYDLRFDPPLVTGDEGGVVTGDDPQMTESETPLDRDAVPTEQAPASESPVADPATVILRAWYDERVERGHPKPAQPWPAMLGVVRRMLDAGHSPEAVAWALRQAPAVSTAALTFAIEQRRRPRGRRSTTTTALEMLDRMAREEQDETR
jgi:hypothetical protein